MSIPSQRAARKDHGFALLITITLPAFLVLLLVSLSTLTRVETQAANNSRQLAGARRPRHHRGQRQCRERDRIHPGADPAEHKTHVVRHAVGPRKPAGSVSPAGGGQREPGRGPHLARTDRPQGGLAPGHLFQHKVIACDPFVPSAVADELNVEMVPLEELFARSDVVSCHTPLLDSTRGMLQRRHFEAMKPGATFLNTARGAIVDEAALCAVLAQRPDLVALIDVTDPEPPPADSPLRRAPNILLTSHIAGCLGPECRRMGLLMLDELDRYLNGRPLHHELDRQKAELTA